MEREKFLKKYGLIGKELSHSFSKEYFNRKFSHERISAVYHNLEFESLELLRDFIRQESSKWDGLNVTIPYKIPIISFIDKLTKTAKDVGAVNTLIIRENHITGHNTDVAGFNKSLSKYLKPQHNKALILGTGGASKAVAYTLKLLGIKYIKVSRSPQEENQISYRELNADIIAEHKLIINTTPLGMYPEVDKFPPLPYSFISNEHLLFDLIYNPDKTPFLIKGEDAGANIVNGKEMLILQAEESWKAWNEIP